MNRIVLTSKVDRDGVLRMAIPIGMADADREVRVMLEPLPPKRVMTQEEYAAWVESMAGIWQGDFERPPQGAVRG